MPRADLSDDLLQPNPQTKGVKVKSAMSDTSLSMGKRPLKRKYGCDEPICGKEYAYKVDLDNHKRKVHGADKLKCHDSNCPALFVSSKSVSAHMWVKHGIGKGPKCEECGKKEPKVAYLKNHKRAVHGAPKLQCKEPGCTKTFIRFTDMYMHRNKKHK